MVSPPLGASSNLERTERSAQRPINRVQQQPPNFSWPHGYALPKHDETRTVDAGHQRDLPLEPALACPVERTLAIVGGKSGIARTHGTCQEVRCDLDQVVGPG